MARVRFGNGIKAFRGNIDGLVFYGYQGRNYVRVHRETRDPGTEKQMVMRRRFATAVHAWQALEPEERDFWRARGRRLRRNGYNAFLSCYMIHMHGDIREGGVKAPTHRKDAFGTPSVPLPPPFVPPSLERISGRFYLDSPLL